MSLPTGAHLGPYRIESFLGAGGMGEVYRARDTRLDRTVAVKILPSEFARDARRRARLQREAKSLAGLSHPHICALHDIGEHDGVDFLVMELLDGETLADRLARGPLPLAQALTYGIEIADALAGAHRLGIVHRDLKPGNVMITRAGAKLLDFGLAKPSDDAAAVMGEHTMTRPLSAEGEIVGTLSYMAPEQLEGGTADARTDIYAFGLLLYEMLSGRPAFGGTHQATVIGRILHSEPSPLQEVAAHVPPSLVRLIRSCIARNPDDRWASAHDVRLLLDAQRDGSDAVTASAPAGGRRRREVLAWTIAGVALVVAVAALAGPPFRPGTPDAMPVLDLVSLLPPANVIQPFADAPQISPDGRHVAFVATDPAGRTWLYVRSLDADAARPLPATEDASQPFWAPDSRRLGFFAAGQLKTTSLDADRPQTIAPAPVPRGGAWGARDVILFSPIPSLPLQQVNAAGGAVTAVTGPTDEAMLGTFPSFLPDGRRYLFLGRASVGAPFVIRVGSLDSQEVTTLVAAKSQGIFAAPGHLLYWREGALVAHAFDPVSVTLSGQPVPIVKQVGFNAITYQALMSVSETGRLAYQSTVVQAELNWYDRKGQLMSTVGSAGGYNTLCFMSDPRHLVYELADERTGNVDLWTVDLDGGPPSRLTFSAAVDFYPVCPPRGAQVIFSSLREGAPNLLSVPIDAPGSESMVWRSPLPKISTDVSRDGQWLIFSALQAGTAWDLFVMPLPGGEPRVFAATPAEERNARLSPDGRWLAYVSNESGRFEVYVQPFPATGARWQVSSAGGNQPQWRRDGRELYFVALDKKLVAVDAKPSGSSFAWGEPRALMETRMTGWERVSAGCCQYAVSADGGRFLISTATSAATPITVALNWPALLPRTPPSGADR